MIITLVITALVVLNFFLLAFSCNSTPKKQAPELKPVQDRPILITNQLETYQLAPTGS